MTANNQEAQVLSDERLKELREFCTGRVEFHRPQSDGSVAVKHITAAEFFNTIAAQAKTIAGLREWRPIESAPSNEWHQLWNEDAGGWIGYWPANYEPGDPLPTHWKPYFQPTPPAAGGS